MTKLRHFDHQGTVRFVTFSCYQRFQLLTEPKIIRLFLSELKRLRFRRIKILGYVVMPEHVHLVLYPSEPVKLGKEIGRLKSISAKKMLPLLESVQSTDRLYKKSYPTASHQWMCSGGAPRRYFWQRRCYDHNCRLPETVQEKIEYCHKNPVTRGLVENPADYPWSSFRWYEGLEGIELEIDGYDF
jgi:putative transposase